MLLRMVLVLLGGIPPAALAQDPAPEERELSVEAPLATRSLLLDGVSLNGRVVVVGERGHILLSDDHGRSWRQARVPTRTTLTGVYFHDSRLGWAVGHDAVILRTRDGGESWERIYYAPDQERPFLDVWFRDRTKGIAIGAYGLFLVTADGGDTWSPRAIEGQSVSRDRDELAPTDLHLNHIARSDTGRLYISAEAGAIFRSDDDGEHWKALSSPYHGSFFGTLALRNDSLLVFGLRGHLFRSDDGGESWQQEETATEAMLTAGLRLAEGTIVITGLGGVMLVSRDGGESFTLREEPGRGAISSVTQTDDGTVILIGEFGVKVIAPREYASMEDP